MKSFITILFCLLSALCFSQGDTIIYPIAPQSNTVDTIWDTEVKDPYRPLEADNDMRRSWLKEEEQVTENYFKNIKHKSALEEDYDQISKAYFNIPRHLGPYYIESMRNSFGAIDIYYKERLYNNDERKLLLSPRSVDKNLNIFNTISISPNGQYFAYSYSKNGSDWQEIGIYDIQKEKILKDHISNVRYIDKIVWLKNGFYYFSFDSVDEARKYLDVSLNEKIYYHTVGSYERDSLIYEDEDNPYATYSLQMINGRFLIITETDPNSHTTIIKFKDYDKNSAFHSIHLKKGFDFSIIGSKADKLYALTTYPDAYNGSIVEINPNDLTHWEIIIANQKDFLIKAALNIHQEFFLIYQQGFQQYIAICSDSGDVIKTIKRFAGSSTDFLGYSPEENSLILSQKNFFCPPIGELLSLKNDSISYIAKTSVSFDPFRFKVDIRSYPSADGTSIPILIIYSKNYENKGPRPTLLDFYGGFGITPEASFDPGLIIFLNNGGVFAFANIRGGANSVKGWHEMGALLNKQKTFDDVYYAVRFLIDSGYADRTKIALEGGSNGGLVGAVVVNQHPELFKAALLSVGVYDMIRAEKFTVGGYNGLREYGTTADIKHFKNLLSYSPLHNIKANTEYPSMLISTAEYDDRVPPLHSYKYIASLQQLTNSKRPILLRIERREGHNTQSIDKAINSNAHMYSFLFKELGMKFHAFGNL
jgi:prolyl oligopeptidase